MDRRGFFRSIARSVRDAGGEAPPPPRIPRRIRPPFALADPHFTLTCTRCDECITACPYQVLVRLPEDPSALDRGTPVMALGLGACHLCDGWPCVAACEPKALVLPEMPAPIPPAMAAVRIDPALCLPFSGPECGACRGSCPVPGALVWDGIRPVLTDACIGCGLCRVACIAGPKAITLSPLEAPHVV
jgi:ferredoxin-type protein NapG